MEKAELKKKLSKIYLVFGLILIFISFAILSISFYPSIWYNINDNATTEDEATIVKLVDTINIEEKEETKQEETITKPTIDTTLPKTNTIIISSIGVNSEIIQNTDAKTGLDKGIWIVPNYGTPENNTLPIIIAAHRFGYVWWTEDFRTTSSFYYLPKTKVGDRIEIIWNQRKYEYEIYLAEDSTQITDYNADLILYTCRMYNSSTRVFRYLKRVS